MPQNNSPHGGLLPAIMLLGSFAEERPVLYSAASEIETCQREILHGREGGAAIE